VIAGPTRGVTHIEVSILVRTPRISPKTPEIMKRVKGLPGHVEVASEAGPTGFGLARALIAAGVRCHVLAPSKMDRPSGDRVKTDLLTELPDRIRRASQKLQEGWLGCVVMINDGDAPRDLSRLVVPQCGSLEATGNLFAPLRTAV
jgi:hypothetical protein